MEARTKTSSQHHRSSSPSPRFSSISTSSSPRHMSPTRVSLNTSVSPSSSSSTAMEILSMIGFSEDNIIDEQGNREVYLVLKRNDPGLWWLAKSTLEANVA